MIIQILMLVFILFLLALAYNLWSHLDKKFLIYSPSDNLKLRNVMKFTSILLIVISIIGVLILVLGSKEANFITLLLGSITAAGFSIYLGNIRG
jgi:TRAP-type C4-dicarboxylate transport system permease small subunit